MTPSKVVDARARAEKSVRKQPLPPKIPKWKISHTITQDFIHGAVRVYAALNYYFIKGLDTTKKMIKG